MQKTERKRRRKLKRNGEKSKQGIRKKKPLKRSRSNFFSKVKMITNLLPAEATHTTFDLFEKQPLLITFDNAFTPDGPMLEFEVYFDRNNFIDLQKLLLEIKCKISRKNDGDLRTGTDATNTDAPYFSNNALHSFFQNALYLLTVLKFPIQTEIMQTKHSLKRKFLQEKLQKTWLVCQGYYYEDEPAKIDGTDGCADQIAARKALVANSQENYFIGKPASDILTCDKHLLSGVTLRISFRRSTNDFAVISESNKHYQVRIIEANLYVRKMTIADRVLTAIEKTLLKTPAVYRYTEVLPRTFLATTGIRSWSHEDIFSKEPVRRMVIAMATNQAYLGTNRTNPFHYQKFNLSQIVVYRNGQPIVGTPVSTTFNHRIYFNTLEALDFLDKGAHGITLDNYPNHFILAFDLTSMQEASHDFIHQELTNCSISVQLTFDGTLAANVEILFQGERSSTFYVNSERKVTKNSIITYSTDG